MLGRLLSSASSTTSSPAGTRPSTAVSFEGEDLYTRTLLYPDGSLLSHNNSLSGSGYISGSSLSIDGEHIDIDGCRDVRVIIAQDGTGTDGKVVVYDSKPGANIATQHISPPNYNSFDDGTPLSPGLCGGFNRRRRSPNPFQPVSSGTGVLAPKGEWRMITDCMFGAVSLAYKGPSTKLHILPSLPQDDKSGTTTPLSDLRSRSDGIRSRGFSNHPNPFSHHTPSKDRKSVLITRLFSVAIPASTTARYFVPQETPDRTPTPSTSLGSTNGFPFPAMPTQGVNTMKPMKPTKTSMYGIGLVISLPQSSSSNTIKRCPNCWTIQYDFESRRVGHGYYCCDVAAACMEDEYRTDSVSVESGHEGIADDQIELITRHWDIITRALAELQSFAQSKIVESLKATGIVSPTFAQPGYKYHNRVELRPGALMYNELLRLEVERFKWRIVSGIKVPRVVTGQGRWGVWRDEARWLNKRFGGKEQNFLFLTLMTAFLGHHTEWLDVLGPVEYRSKHQQQKNVSSIVSGDSSLPTRTVIISHDKIVARRLIYLLSAFLPAKTLPAWPVTEPTFLNSRNSSSNMLSQSPPMMSYMSQGQLSRGSTRRKPRKRPSKLSMIHGEAGEEGGWDIPVVHGTAEATLLRQQSDASMQLPVLSLGSSRKHHNAATTTAAHHRDSRPGSAGSSASFSLIHTLRRSGTGHASTDSSATGASGWSFLSNIWSNPQPSTVCTSEADELHSSVCPEKYDEEVVVQDHDLYPGYEDHAQSPPRFDSVHFTPLFQQDAPLNVSLADDGVVDVEVPFGPTTFLIPPVLGHSTANSASPIGSPASAGCNFSLLSLDRSSLSFSSLLHNCDDTTDTTVNVAGWMEDERFHPDFSLQAVKPYAELEADIKRSMRAEPTPSVPSTYAGTLTGRWIDVCTVLLADTRTFTIKRLKLKRRRRVVSPLMTDETTAMTHAHRMAIPIPSHHHATSFSATVEEEIEDEEFEEEWVMDMDDTLATAVERTIGVEAEYSCSRTAKSNKTRSALSKEPIPPSTPDSQTNKASTTCLGSDCKGLILGALEEVVKMCATGRRATGTIRGTGFVDNVLTEGVVRWLNDVEEVSNPHHTTSASSVAVF